MTSYLNYHSTFSSSITYSSRSIQRNPYREFFSFVLDNSIASGIITSPIRSKMPNKIHPDSVTTDVDSTESDQFPTTLNLRNKVVHRFPFALRFSSSIAETNLWCYFHRLFQALPSTTDGNNQLRDFSLTTQIFSSPISKSKKPSQVILLFSSIVSK